MKNILENRIVVLDVDGNVIEYSLYKSFQHQDCLDDYVKRMGYQFSGYNYIASKGNGIFCNAGNNILVVYLPEILNEKQLYMLDYMENWLEDVYDLVVAKINDKEEIVSKFKSNGDVIETFDNVIQSYYCKKNRRK